jgi:hypothetical protein
VSKRERKVKDNKEKNKEKKDGGWCTEDIRFDQEGCLYIANKDLARMIQQNLNAWGGRLCMFRDFVDDDGDGKDDDGGVITDNKVNMMCPCAPEP